MTADCKYCGKTTNLIDAHIIPESFFRDIDLSRSGLRMYSAKEDQHPKRSPIGVYDTGILCQACEDKFAPFDDYAARLLIQREFQRESIDDEEGHLGYYIFDVDYRRLKLFGMSVLWRAAISSQDYFNYIRLGSHFFSLDRMVKDLNPGGPQDFSLLIWEELFPDNKVVMIKGYRTRILDGLRFYAIPMGKFVLLIKVDRRNIEDIESNMMILKPNTPLAVSEIPFQGSKHEEIIRGIIKRNSIYRKPRHVG
jgi:hypothetical protein